MTPMFRNSLVAAGLALSVCLANASVASATPSPIPTATSAPGATVSATSVTPWQTAIIKIKTLLTTFYTDQQLSGILNRMAENIYAGRTLDETFDALASVDGLTATQLAKRLKLGSGLRNDLGSASGVPWTKARTVFQPFYSQASATVLQMKRSGRSKADCLKQVDVVLAGQLTKANISRALTQYKSSLTSQEWQSVRTHGADLLLWSSYGL